MKLNRQTFSSGRLIGGWIGFGTSSMWPLQRHWQIVVFLWNRELRLEFNPSAKELKK